ncbi:MAG: hypothetical protein RMH77_04120 [Sulfolobales archaeon]|nr:hypothetical protein [Sulfolobales archaeon]MCX8185632.1 hypothetical protein [Sulfolobales archaeon]MDW7969575.1 hypothetical protein [Sulfolobales archaeon]
MTVNYRSVKESLERVRDLSNLSDRVKESLYEKRVLRLVCGDTYLWIFNSRDRDYLIIPRMYCSCMDFELNVVIRKTKKYCYHLITQHIAEGRALFKELHVSKESLNDILVEVLYIGRSSTLRKLLAYGGNS